MYFKAGLIAECPESVVRINQHMLYSSYQQQNRLARFMKSVIITKFNEALEQTNIDKHYDHISDDQVLLESGLDSLGFAILVALLEEELNFDPFQEMENAVYPTTFGEFVAIYENRKA